MKIKLLHTLLFLVISFFGISQKSQITVLNAKNKTAIPFVHIQAIFESTKKDTLVLTNWSGKAIIKGNEGEKVTLSISYMGYKPTNKTITIEKNLTVFLNEDAITLNSFVVTGQYSENSPEKAVQKITIIDKKKIEKMAANNLKDVLSNEMNIRLSQDNILGSGMSLQGMSGENVKILIDGVPVIGRLNGNVDLSQINLNDIERIEIIEGPMSVNYGTNALAGVINLISKKNTKKRVNFGVNSYNENIGQYNLDAIISGSYKKHSLSFSGGKNYFDGWIDGDQTFGEKQKIADSSRFKSWKPKTQYFGKANYNYQLKNGNIKYTFGLFNEKIINKGYPRLPYYEKAFDDYYYTNRIDNALVFNKRLKHDRAINVNISYNDYKRVKNTFFKDLTTLEQVQTANSSDQDTTRFNQWIIRSTFSTSKDSSKINYEIGMDLNTQNAYGKRIENKTQQMGDYAGFLSLEYKPFENTIIRPGVRYSHNTIYEAPVTPSLNVKQTIGKFNLRASYAKGFRAPSLKELYFDFVDINHNIVGNTNLIAEQSHNFNFSANYTKNIKSYLVKMEISSFYNKIKNLITLAQKTGSEYSYVNIGDYQTHGFQINNNISYKHFKFGIGGSLIGRYNYLSEELDVQKFSYAPELKSNLNYELPEYDMFFSVFYKFTGKLPSFRINSSNEITQRFVNSYQTADLSIGKKFWKKRINLILGSKNLFDVKNVNSFTSGSAHSGNSGGSPIAMGRTYFVKISLNLSYDKNK